jgi:hypothetical protein
MLPSARDSYFDRLLEILLPHGGMVVPMYEGYFDESGSLNEEPRIFCIAGYFINSDSARVMDSAWRAVLAQYELPYFHMVDCAHDAGRFKRLSMDDRVAIQTQLISLIKQHTLAGFAVLVKVESFEPSLEIPDAYHACAFHCVKAMLTYLDTYRLARNVAFIFEKGHPSAEGTYAHVAQRLGGLDKSSLAFMAKGDAPLLQAADLLAWQSVKYLKDRHAHAHAPRKDFLSLMEHSHTFVTVRLHKTDAVMEMSQWPANNATRPGRIYYGPDEPITLIFEENDQIPIVPVSEVREWRKGVGPFINIELRDLKDRPFELAVEPAVLRDCAIAFTNAINANDDGYHTYVIDAVRIWKEGETGGHDVIAVELGDGGILRFGIPKGVS